MIVWQRAHQFTIETYTFTARLPKEELFGLSSQARRPAVSVAANIVEAFARKSKKDKLRILNIALASLEECRYLIRLSSDLNYGDGVRLTQRAKEVSKVLNAYIRAIEQDLKGHG